MEERNKKYIAAMILGMSVGFVLWVTLIALKAAGVIDVGWGFVMSSLLWISWIMWGIFGLTMAAVSDLKRLRRRRKIDARIVRQAKAAGVWNTNAGGRALELYAKECGVKKFPGETDAHLRQRIKEAAEIRGGRNAV